MIYGLFYQESKIKDNKWIANERCRSNHTETQFPAPRSDLTFQFQETKKKFNVNDSIDYP